MIKNDNKCLQCHWQQTQKIAIFALKQNNGTKMPMTERNSLVDKSPKKSLFNKLDSKLLRCLETYLIEFSKRRLTRHLQLSETLSITISRTYDVKYLNHFAIEFKKLRYMDSYIAINTLPQTYLTICRNLLKGFRILLRSN